MYNGKLVRALAYVINPSQFLTMREIYGIADMGDIVYKDKKYRAYYFSVPEKLFDEMLEMKDENIYRIERVTLGKSRYSKDVREREN